MRWGGSRSRNSSEAKTYLVVWSPTRLLVLLVSGAGVKNPGWASVNLTSREPHGTHSSITLRNSLNVEFIIGFGRARFSLLSFRRALGAYCVAAQRPCASAPRRRGAGLPLIQGDGRSYEPFRFWTSGRDSTSE